MMKSIKYHIAGLVFVVFGMVACEYSQDVEPVVSPDGYPQVTVTPVEPYSAVKEGDTIFFNVTTNETIDRALTFNVRIVDGNADADDFLSTAGVIAPYSTSSQIMVTFPQDWDAEATENLSFEVGIFSLAEKYIVHPSTKNPVFPLTIENFVSDILTVEIGWGTTITGLETVYGETKLPNGEVIEWVDTVEVEYDAADYMDFDVLISPAATFDPADPWASDMGNTSGATGNNPEVFEGALPDGEYVLWTDLWYNELYDPEEHEMVSFDDSTLTVATTANFVRQGTSLDLDVDLTETNVPFVFQPGAVLSYSPIVYSGYAFNGVIAKIIVANGVYTIVNYEDDTELGAARKSTMKARTPRPAALRRLPNK